jgi:hypothetical protein
LTGFLSWGDAATDVANIARAPRTTASRIAAYRPVEKPLLAHIGETGIVTKIDANSNGCAIRSTRRTP